MRKSGIPDSDNLFRHVIYPTAFKRGRVSVEKLFYFTSPDRNNSDELHGSLAWERYEPTAKYVHAHGRRMADQRSRKDEETQRFIYCGAYQLKAMSVRELRKNEGLSDVHFADVIHSEEDGEISHVDLRILLKPQKQFNDIEGTKTAIRISLWNASSGPIRDEPRTNQGIGVDPKMELELGPKGAYKDTRSPLRRTFWLLRYWVLLLFGMRLAGLRTSLFVSSLAQIPSLLRRILKRTNS